MSTALGLLSVTGPASTRFSERGPRERGGGVPWTLGRPSSLALSTPSFLPKRHFLPGPCWLLRTLHCTGRASPGQGCAHISKALAPVSTWAPWMPAGRRTRATPTGGASE